MDLLDIVQDTQAALRAKPESGIATFVVESRQVEGVRSEAKIRQFTVTLDEAPTIGGTDAGPNPVEFVLAALAACQEITYRAYAAALRVPLEQVSVKLEGDLDLRGFLAVSDNVRPGFTGVRGVVTLVSSASPTELETLKRIVDAHCPVLDMLRAPVPVRLALNTVTPIAVAAG